MYGVVAADGLGTLGRLVGVAADPEAINVAAVLELNALDLVQNA